MNNYQVEKTIYNVVAKIYGAVEPGKICMLWILSILIGVKIALPTWRLSGENCLSTLALKGFCSFFLVLYTSVESEALSSSIILWR